MARALIGLLLLASLTACNKVKAQAPAPSAPLTTPAPPDRLVVPVQVEVPEPPPPAAPPSTTPQQLRPNASATPTRPPDRPQPPATAPVSAPPEAPAPVLQTTADVSVIEQQAREKITLAQGYLARVAPGSLATAAKNQYSVAKRYVEMAQDAIKNKNYPYALELAKKAAAMSGLLVKG